MNLKNIIGDKMISGIPKLTIEMQNVWDEYLHFIKVIEEFSEEYRCVFFPKGLLWISFKDRPVFLQGLHTHPHYKFLHRLKMQAHNRYDDLQREIDILVVNEQVF